MKTKFFGLLVAATLLASGAMAQQSLVYNSYYLNPFLYNPSFIAPTGYSELYLNYRKQWAGIEGAPTTYTMNLHLPLSYKAGVAFSAYQDQAGLLKTTSGMVSFGYQIYLGTRITDIHKISFGLSAGVTNSRIDAGKANDFTDPVLGNNTSSMDGQVGIHYRYNGLKIGFAIPRMFDTKVASEQSFNKSGISQLNTTITSVAYEIRLNERFSLEPIATYRTYENLDSHFEGVAAFRASDIGWIGGGYRQNYGGFGFLGFTIKDKLKFGYAYEFATDQTDKIGQGSHEVQLSLRLGRKQFARPQLVKKTSTQQVAKTVEPQTQPKAIDPVEEDNQSNVIDPVGTDREELARRDNAAEQLQDVDADQEHQKELPSRDQAPQIVEKSIQPQPADDAEDNAPMKVTRLSGEGLEPGHYVVVGAFRSLENAKSFASTLKKSGYPANVAFQPEKGYYIVHMDKPVHTLDEARTLRDKYRQMSRYSFRDTWVLSID